MSKNDKITLPCKIKDFCPYEYEYNPERDVEGMPFIDDDPRSCPKYGHICPEFMEDLGLTVEDLNIRAIIHCGSVAKRLAEIQKQDLTGQTKLLVEKFEEYLEKYPPKKYPKYY